MPSDYDFCTIRISPGVLATIAGLTTMAVPGVLRTTGGFAGGVGRLVKRDNPTRGVKVRMREERLCLEVHVVVEQGADLVRVGSQIQRDVAEAIDKMVGVPVAQINVYVQDME